MSLTTTKPKDWKESDLDAFVKELRRKTKPILIAANKSDLLQTMDIFEKIDQEFKVIPCSAETELLLKKAAKAGFVDYISGDNHFSISEGAKISGDQKKALELVQSVFSKLNSTGVQTIMNSVVFDLLKFIVVYPVEDETKLCNRDGKVLPDAKLLSPNSSIKDLAGTIHADLAKGLLHAIDVKTKQRIGADHILQNGDVIKIVSSLSRG